MSIYYTRGGFHAASYDIDNTGLTETQRIRRNFMAQLISLFTASRKDATARGAAYTQYWDFDDNFFDGVASGATGYTAAEMCGTDTAMQAAFQAVTSRQSGNICVRANSDTNATHPCYGTVLKGQGGEYIYLCWCAGVRTALAETTDTGYGLVIHANNTLGYSGHVYHNQGNCHVWYCPDPYGGGAAIYPFGGVHPGLAAFFANAKTLWLMDGGFTQIAESYTGPTTSPSAASVNSIRHVVLCKDDVIIFGERNNGSNSNEYDWLVLGKGIVEATDGVTPMAGMFPLQAVVAEMTTNYRCLMHSYITNRVAGDMAPAQSGTSFHYTDDKDSQSAPHYQLTCTMNVFANRLADKPMPLSPIAVMAYPNVSVTSMTSSCTLKDGQSLIGYLRGDIARSTVGLGLTQYNTLDNGNYMILHSATWVSYSTNYVYDCYRLLIGWDSSNTVTL